MDTREKFRLALKGMRSRGLITRMGFMCCGSCAAAELDDVLAARPNRVGAVYTSREGWPKADDKFSVNLNYGARREEGDESMEVHYRKTALIGEIVVEELRKTGFRPIWDGTPQITILVDEEEADKREEAEKPFECPLV